jgi:hypothetical protein
MRSKKLCWRLLKQGSVIFLGTILRLSGRSRRYYCELGFKACLADSPPIARTLALPSGEGLPEDNTELTIKLARNPTKGAREFRF